MVVGPLSRSQQRPGVIDHGEFEYANFYFAGTRVLQGYEFRYPTLPYPRVLQGYEFR